MDSKHVQVDKNQHFGKLKNNPTIESFASYSLLVGSRIEVPCAIRVLEELKVFSYRFEDAESNERGLTSGKCGELSLEGVFQNGGQNTLNWHYGS